MKISLPKISLLLLLASVLLFCSCKKNETSNPGNTADLATEVNASVSGFVTDESDEPVIAAQVNFGSLVSTTDKYGFFEIKNTNVVQNAAVVTVSKQGYFKGIKTFMVTANRSAFCRVKLIPKTITGTITAANGGSVVLSNGLKVALPANAVVNASTNAAYTGTVHVASYWIDPAIDHTSMPGDGWGLDKDGAIKALKGFSMAAVEMTGTAGELLQIAANKKAILTMPIPSSVLSTAPENISLGYMDEEKGYWKDEGGAVKSGNSYVAEVGHFSYWFSYFSGQSLVMKCRITDASGNPFKNIEVGIWSASLGIGNTTYTDDNGVVFGNIPWDVNLLDILDAGCIAYSTPISVTNVIPTTYNGYYYPLFADLGDIIVPPTALATITGNVINCVGAPVSNGYVIVRKAPYTYRTTLDVTGNFSILTTFCTSNQNLQLIAEDLTAVQQSTTLNFAPVNSGNNNVGTLMACGLSAQEYFNYTIDGNSYSFVYPIHNFSQDYNYIGAQNDAAPVNDIVAFSHQPQIIISAGSMLNLQYFSSNQYTVDTLVSFPSITVNFTEYGAINEFISGYFSGTAIGMPPANSPHTISCNFRVRRFN